MKPVSFAHRSAVLVSVLLAACGGARSAPPGQAPEAPEAVVALFLAAANANDLDAMALRWGDERGPSSQSNWIEATERQRRLQIMQRLLTSNAQRVVTASDAPDGVRVVEVELTQGTRQVTVPFRLVRTRSAGAWVIKEIGLESAMPQPAPRQPAQPRP